MNIHKIPVFPAADVFPMMAEDELQELADDIKANGLREPLVLAEVADGNGELHEMLIDGRNRRKACKIAGVEPEVRRLNGEDPTAYVLSANIHRRHMTKGQRAMATAIVYPKSTRGRGNIDPARKHADSASFRRVQEARLIVRYSIENDLAQEVLSGAKPLDDAYKEACDRRDRPSEEQRLTKLRSRYADLADKVVDSELTLKGAEAEADERDFQSRENRDRTFESLSTALKHVRQLAADAENEDVRNILTEFRKDFRKRFDNDDALIDAAITDFQVGSQRMIELLKNVKEARRGKK